ncbi:MAG: hypothetical protein KC457_17195 [Myxococcales bacterium]|nr:hypothetical protein [Myxococcales bacterium]
MLSPFLAAFLSVCPPSSEDPATEGFLIIPSLGLGETLPTTLERAPRAGPTTDLPLADLDAAWAELEAIFSQSDPSATPELHWLAWAIADARDQPATAFAHLVHALAVDDLDAARVMWWRALSPAGIDRRDALRGAWQQARAPETRALLATVLALELWDASCPSAPEPDGACRLGGRLLARSPIAVEEAERWTARATALSSAHPSRDPAARSLAAALELAAAAPDYELLLATRMPEDLDFVVEDWRHDSGIPAWEAIYARQLETAAESQRRFGAVADSFVTCLDSVTNTHAEVITIDSEVAAIALLRTAELLLTADAFFFGASDAAGRRQGREDEELGRHSWQCPLLDNPFPAQATAALERCVALGTTSSHPAIEACRTRLSALDPEGHPSQAELFGPDPARPRLEAYGVVGPQNENSRP